MILSYDIACQYERNFWSRFKARPQFLNAPTRIGLKFLVPKFHLPAHQESCRYHYSLNFAKGVGRTCGEGIERTWAKLNLLSGSTSRMTFAGREDTLNNQCNDLNWKKTCHMGLLLFPSFLPHHTHISTGTTLLQRLENGRKMEAKHKLIYDELKESLEDSKAEVRFAFYYCLDWQRIPTGMDWDGGCISFRTRSPLYLSTSNWKRYGQINYKIRW